MIPGFAKSLFLETYRRTPWKKNPNLGSRWPLLDGFLSQQCCSYLDYVLVHRLLKPYPTASQEVALFICHLIMAAREGHLCVKVDQQQIIPDIRQLWQKNASHVLSSDEVHVLNDFIIKGLSQIPVNLMTELETNDLDKYFLTPLCRYQNCIYLQRHWIFESLFLKCFKNHVAVNPTFIMDSEQIKKSVQELSCQGIVLDEQAQAIEKACLHSLSIITGGPGTGKTYTAGQIIKIFWNNLTDQQKLQCEIAVAAPTGKAVANLQKNLSKIIMEVKGLPEIKARTLHSLLGIRGISSYSRENVARLTADFIIIDESSMIDLQLMAILFEAIKKGSRVILLGDQHQLPSVEAGSIFADLIHLASVHQECSIPYTQLKTCLRAELKSIIDFAAMVNEGLADQVLKILDHGHYPGIHRLNLSLDKKEAHQQFLKYVSGFFPSIIKKEMKPIDLLHLFQSIRILSPMRKGPFGVDELNHLIWSHFNSTYHKEGWIAIPIMIVANDYRRDLFNGETGTLMKKLPCIGMNKDDYALFPARQGDQEVRKISASLLPKYEYAYCLSVHKSQGSEFDRIVLVMPEGSELFGREVFYTAITRARKQIDIYGTDPVLHKTILQKGTRLSGIRHRYF